MKKFTCVCLMVALLAVFMIPLAVHAQEKVIRIGAMYPMTGRAGLYGIDSVAAAEMAIDEINAKGGVNGYMIDATFTDSKARPAYAVRVATRYITEDKVHFLFGVVSSGVGLAVTEISRQHKIIFIGTDHASTQLTVDKLQPYYFRVSNNTYMSMAAGALYLQERKKTKDWNTIAYIGADYAYGHDQWNELKSNLDLLGVKYKVVGEYWPKLFEPDYTAYITSLGRDNPDILVSGFWGGDTVAFIKQAMPYCLLKKALYFHPDAGGNYELMSAMGDELPAGLVLGARHYNNWPDTELNRNFVKEFQHRTGRFPTYAASGAYVGIHAIAKAVEAVGNPDDTEALVKALENLDLQAPWDPDGFTSKMRSETHQLKKMQAIGVTMPNNDFPPAKMMLGDWKIYSPEQVMPPADYIKEKRK